MMFTRPFFVALMALAVSVQAVPSGTRFASKANATKSTSSNSNSLQCAAPKTVTATNVVTVTRGVAATATAGTGSKTTSSAAATKTSAAAGNAGNGNTSNGNTDNGNTGNGNTGNTGNGNTGNGNTGNGNTGNDSDPQKSLTLDPRVLATSFANDGQDVPTAGQVASLTSTNNFINFCLTAPNLPITNGKQITTGSCNPAPIGMIPSVDNMPSSKFDFPANFATIKANTTFTISMRIQKMQTGAFVNAQQSYFAAPQQLNGKGQIIGHSHAVIEQLTSLFQTTPTDPKNFVFFKGLNEAAVNGKLTATVTGGLAPGFYKLSSINTSSNHQPAIVPVAQHGSLDDAVYFTVTTTGQALGTRAQASTSTSTASKGKRRALNRLSQ